MIGHFFESIFSLWAQVLSIDFGIGIPLGNLIVAFFTLLAFIRFFIRPILGGKLGSGGSSERPSRKEGK